MVAHPPGIENETARRRRKGRRWQHRDKASLAIGGKELAIAKHPGARLAPHWPLGRWQAGVIGVEQTGQVEVATAVIFKGRQRGMFGKDLAWVGVTEGIDETHTLGDFLDDPPVGTR